MPKTERQERTAELLETFSLYPKRNERTRTLSGGMKRRLILARALMHRPRLLILDEPTAGVDIELRLELWHYVQQINAEGTTILLTTHYLEEAEQLCDKIAFINDGEIAACGSTASSRRGTASRASRTPTSSWSGARSSRARRSSGGVRMSALAARARARVGGRLPSMPLTTGQIRFLTLWRREINRFMKIKKQTIGAPLLETFLYISVFGAALGTRINTLHGFKYVDLRDPGPDHDGLGDERVLEQRVARSSSRSSRARSRISSPRPPRRRELLLAFSLGGFTRGGVVAVLTFIAASILIDLPVEHVLILIPGLFLVGFFFGQLGVLIGVRAEQFDDVSVAQTFVLHAADLPRRGLLLGVAAARAVVRP